MNKVFITGLANRSFCSDCDHEEGGQEKRRYLSNFNFLPIVDQPEMALWIDKLVLSKNVYKVVAESNQQLMDMKVINIFLELFEKNKLIEIVDTDELLTKDVMKVIEKEINQDLQALANNEIAGLTFASAEKPRGLEEPFVLQIEEIPYCEVHLISIYADLYLSQKTKTNGLFSSEGMKYCNYKFGLARENPTNISEINKGIDKIFSLHVPYDFNYTKLLYSRLLGVKDGQCETCLHSTWCESKNLKDLETYLAKLFEWRRYDEFEQLRLFIGKLVNDSESKNGQTLSQNIVNDYLKEIGKINHKLHVVLPKIKSFFNVLTAISIPLTLGAIASGDKALVAAGAVVSATKTGVDLITKTFENKYKWVGFKIENLERKIVEQAK